eukprot:ctg_809.g389
MLPGFVYPTPLRHSVGARWVQHGRRRCDGGGARLNPPRRSRHLHRLRSADDSAPGRRPRHTPQDATLPQNDAFFSPGFDTEEVVVRRPSTPTPEQLVKPGEAEWSRQADDAHTVGFESEDLVLREPMDPTPLRTEEERRRNQPVVTLAERRRLMREWRRQREQEAARLRLQEAVREETKAQLQGAKGARVESVPLARDTLRGRETGEDYWIDLQDLVPQDGVYRGHRRPRVAALWNRVLGRTAGDEDDDGDDGGEEPGRDERAGRTVALGVDDEGAEEVAIQHLLEEMQRPAHTTPPDAAAGRTGAACLPATPRHRRQHRRWTAHARGDIGAEAQRGQRTDAAAVCAPRRRPPFRAARKASTPPRARTTRPHLHRDATEGARRDRAALQTELDRLHHGAGRRAGPAHLLLWPELAHHRAARPVKKKGSVLERTNPHQTRPHPLRIPPSHDHPLCLPVQVHHHRQFGDGKIVPAAAFHRRPLPVHPRPDHRGGVWSAGDHLPVGRDRQVTDLGHGGAGVVPLHHPIVLPRLGGGATGVRYRPTGDVSGAQLVAGGLSGTRHAQHHYCVGGQQDRPGAPTTGAAGGGRSVRQGARPAVCRGQRQDRRARRRGVYDGGGGGAGAHSARRDRRQPRAVRRQAGHAGWQRARRWCGRDGAAERGAGRRCSSERLLLLLRGRCG